MKINLMYANKVGVENLLFPRKSCAFKLYWYNVNIRNQLSVGLYIRICLFKELLNERT